MYILRRAAVRAVAQQPSRAYGSFQQRGYIGAVAAFQTAKPIAYRSFHSAQVWRAEHDKESPAEAESSEETVDVEPSQHELRQEVREESIATSDVADGTSSAGYSGPGVVERAQEFAGHAADTARSTYNSVLGHRSSDGFQKPPSKILYVGNLFFEVSESELSAEFARFGTIANTRIVSDVRGLSKGFGFVEFETQDAADAAMHALDQQVLQGRRMSVQYHQRREKNDFSKPNRQSNEPSKTLFIGNLSYQMSDRDLNDLFREMRDVVDVRVAIDRRSGQPRGFAHADFIDVNAATRAKELLERKVIYDRQLRVDYSANSAPRSGGSRGERRNDSDE